jgi:hypothetical protein
MRRFTQICLALVGLALTYGTSAWADEPCMCQACQQKLYQQQQKQQQKQAKHHQHGFRSPQMCENCMRAQQANGGAAVAPPMLVANNPGCTTCQALAARSGTMAPAYGTTGYAMTGQPGADPSPVGVMQTGYHPSNVVEALAPGHAVSGGAPNPNDPAVLANGRYVNTLAPQGSRRPHIIMHLLGLPTPEAVRDRWENPAKAAHAATAYGPTNASVSELPASMVYGR